MAVKIKNAAKLCNEKYFCIVHSICEEIGTQMSYTKVMPQHNSSKTKHYHIRMYIPIYAECRTLAVRIK